MEVDALNHKPVYVDSSKQQQFKVNPIIDSNLIISQSNTMSNLVNGSENNKENADNKKEDGHPTEKQLKNAILDANNKLQARRTGCEFIYHDETNRISIKVFDKETNEVLLEVPSEDSLKAFEKVLELAGLIVDEKR